MSGVLGFIATLLFVGSVGLLVVGLVGLFQNQRVYRARTSLLDSVGKAAQEDIADGFDWTWRYNEYETVTYWEMVARPWRDPLSLYDNLDFADAQVRRQVASW